ncbi:MAG: hypothetical protein WCA43_05945, partial [Bradyrhizobium sp.]
ARIDSRLDTAKIGSEGRVEAQRARLRGRCWETKNVSTRPGSKAEVEKRIPHVRFTPESRNPLSEGDVDQAAQSRSPGPGTAGNPAKRHERRMGQDNVIAAVQVNQARIGDH